MIIFGLDAGPAVYHAFIGFDLASTTTSVETTLLGLARLDVLIPSVIGVLREKASRAG